MGSMGANEGPGERPLRIGPGGRRKVVPEGIEGRSLQGAGRLHLQLMGGLRSGMGLCRRRRTWPNCAKARFIRITNAGLIESHPHDVLVTKEAPNYQANPR